MPTDALTLLATLGAPPRLLHHAQLVGEAATQLLATYTTLNIPCDHRTILLGAILHDAGKILHPEELSHPGSLHEPSGEQLLLTHGVPPEIAHCCATHGSWDAPGITFEEQTVALADKLWKGRREPALELSIIDEAARRLSLTRWDLFPTLDTAFETIASDAPTRLQSTRRY